ncbi:MAG: beta-N-acetylhexosaminidase [Bacteroidales bacterium]|nr:beta-N-acetylhexosaminidase [Bacteroidales bacterium]
MTREFVFTAAAALLCACAAPVPETFSVIPMPAEVELSEGVFCVKGAAVVQGEGIADVASAAINAFSDRLATVTGKAAGRGRGTILFSEDKALAPEAYTINLSKDSVLVGASSPNGFLYAIETLKQMLPPAVYGSQKAKADWVLPCGRITDAPRFAHRGLMIDSARHFWETDEMKRIIDVMAMYKLNILHWHLTDDQGWRVEIKKYPRLTEVGAWRNGTMVAKDWDSNDGIRYGGFYTQDELREIVAYAAAKGISVIPEIDLPGHMNAAMAAYPELGCSGGPYEVRTIWGISKDILCAGNDRIYTFIDDVMTELADIFPAEYIHIGGDECFGGRREVGKPVPWDSCPKCRARMRELHIKPGPDARHFLQNYVTARAQDILADKGRRIIGWGEILKGDLQEGATIMSWRGAAAGIEAASKGFDVIMSPNSNCYFDYYQSEEQDKEPLAIGNYLPVEKVYALEPTDGFEPGTESHILGVQANLWTEYIATPEHLEYMLLPRLCAVSEVQWCAPETKDYERFLLSLDHSFAVFDLTGYTYAKHVKGIIGLPGAEQPAEE